jgi:hypothetical protein
MSTLKPQRSGQRRAKERIWARLDPKVATEVRRLVKSMGITMSEYLRQLIIKDLDQRTVFTDQLKRGE